jgi:DNA-binding NarL/FixJ family response regulator
VIQVLLADDEAMVREGLRLLIDAESDMTVVAEAADGLEALQRIRSSSPDVAVIDVRMPGVDGLRVAEQALGDRDWPGKVIMLTTYGEDEYLFAALRAGASGFLLKTSPPRMLPVAIREALAGETMISGALTLRLFERLSVSHESSGSLPSVDMTATLTAREIEVLRRIALGESNAEIAAHLVIAESTVKTHVVHILERLGLRDRTQAAILAHQSGLMH